MKTNHTTLFSKLIVAGILLVALAVASCSTPHHGSGNHRNHMTNSMGG